MKEECNLDLIYICKVIDKDIIIIDYRIIKRFFWNFGVKYFERVVCEGIDSYVVWIRYICIYILLYFGELKLFLWYVNIL